MDPRMQVIIDNVSSTDQAARLKAQQFFWESEKKSNPTTRIRVNAKEK